MQNAPDGVIRNYIKQCMVDISHFLDVIDVKCGLGPLLRCTLNKSRFQTDMDHKSWFDDECVQVMAVKNQTPELKNAEPCKKPIQKSKNHQINSFLTCKG